MAPLNPNNTIRFYIDYHNAHNAHTMVIRTNAVASPANVGTLVDAIFTQAANICAAITYDGARFSVVGSNVTNPVVTGFEGTVYGALGTTEFSEVTSVNFIGRAASGRRVRAEIFGYRSFVSNWRLTSAEDARVAAIVGTMNGAINSFLAIDGTKPIWYQYANVSPNAYWVRNSRL